MVHTLDRMDQYDRAVSANVLRQMSAADIDLGDLAKAVRLSEKTLWARLTEGSFRVRELGLIACALDCRTTELLATDEGAAA